MTIPLTLEAWRRTLNLPMLRWSKTELNPLIDLLPEGAVVAELGSFAGESAVQFLNSPKVAFLLCVDLWKGGYGGEEDVASNADMETARLAFDVRLSAFDPCRYAVRRDSTHVAARAISALFDLVYVDADHGYEATLGDIRAWLPGVKPGGIMAGHDYGTTHGGVKLAVDELFEGKEIGVFPDSSWWVRV